MTFGLALLVLIVIKSPNASLSIFFNYDLIDDGIGMLRVGAGSEVLGADGFLGH